MESIFPCSLSAITYHLIPYKHIYSSTLYRGGTSLPCIAILKNHKSSIHHNKYSPITDQLGDNDGDGETWISYSNASEANLITDNEPLLHQLNVNQALHWKIWQMMSYFNLGRQWEMLNLKKPLPKIKTTLKNIAFNFTKMIILLFWTRIPPLWEKAVLSL